MELIKTPFKGLLIFQTYNYIDNRGNFQKIFNEEVFKENHLECNFKEIYYSVNKKNVIRGMHFQIPPYDHVKMVYVSYGKILDVVVDIRKGSVTYGKYFSVELDAKRARYLYIPKGFAHGFLSLQDNTIVNYAQTTCYNRDFDCGISLNSIGFNWKIKEPIISERDSSFPFLNDFDSPFTI